LEAPALAENERQRSFLLSTAEPEPSESVFTKEHIGGGLSISGEYFIICCLHIP